MRDLTDDELGRLKRYLGATKQFDRMHAFAAGRRASNTYLRIVASSMTVDEPTDYQLTYLQGIARRMSKNYRKLRGMSSLLHVIGAVRDRAFNDLEFGWPR